MAVEALPIGPYSSAFVEEVVCSTTQDEAHHNVPQDFAFTTPACASGAFESDPRMFNYVADPILWGEFPSQQPWASIPSTQVSQAVTSPPIQDHDESDRRALPVESNDHSLLPCPGIQDTADVITDDGMAEGGFTLTCPIPHCYFQCQTVAEVWKHLTWTHVRPNSKESGIECIVERVVLGGGSQRYV